MSLIVFIIVGAIAGFLAGKVMTGHGLGLIWDIVVGILGAFLGGWLAGLVGIDVTNIVVELLVAFVGAVILLALFRTLTRRGMVRTYEIGFRRASPGSPARLFLPGFEAGVQLRAATPRCSRPPTPG
ncbi:MAG TPA: GlsB/YeaQ/YmgE family stress response membrane protein [Candidatus Dormibacteraeota bacterium]|nr:GlsB/YeaQ/YmgE family stress response membrane protein [Candidatus Dormibacteraeota bacterium]